MSRGSRADPWESLRKLVNKKVSLHVQFPPSNNNIQQWSHSLLASWWAAVQLNMRWYWLFSVWLFYFDLYILSSVIWIGLLFSISCLYSCFDTTRIHSFASNMFHSFLLVPSSLLVIYSNTFIVNPCHISMYSSSGVVMEETCRIYICIYKCVCACYIIFFWFLQGTM